MNRSSYNSEGKKGILVSRQYKTGNTKLVRKTVSIEEDAPETFSPVLSPNLSGSVSGSVGVRVDADHQDHCNGYSRDQ